MHRFAVAIVFVASWPSAASAWNALGHKVIAEVAWRELNPPARQKIVGVIRQHPRFDADFAAKMPDDVKAADSATQDRWIFQAAA